MSFFSSGDGPRFAALAAARFEARFRDLPQRLLASAWGDLVELAGESRDQALSPELVEPADDGVLLASLGAADLVCEACLEACGAERWRGASCYADLSAILTSLELPDLDAAGREAWGLLRGLFVSTGAGEPWWVSARFGGSCTYALLDPVRVATLAQAASATGVAERARAALTAQGHYAADDLPALSGFLQRAAERGDWVLGAEWS